MGRRATDRSQRFVAVGGGAGAVAFVLQDAGDQFADVRLIIDDQDIGRHDQTVALCGSAGFGGGRDRLRRKAQLHPGAARARNHLRGVPQLETPAVLFENASDDGEPEPGALVARRHVGFEQPRAVLLRQADAIVDHVDDRRPCRRAAR